VFAFAALTACGPFVPVTDVSTVPREKVDMAYRVRVFTVGSNVNYPEVEQFLGAVTAYSCKNLLWDPPASQGDALQQLRLKAVGLGADAIIDVTFDTRGTDAFGTNCWESVRASGVAVRFKK
jgi:hypothetical protein